MPLTLTTDMRLGFEGAAGRGPDAAQGGRDPVLRAVLGRAEAPKTYERGVQAAGLDRAPLAALAGPRRIPRPPLARHLARSALTLKGLTLAPTGAIAAAATTSLPETPGGERNWDYRYSWIRDSTFALWGLYTLGFDWEANDFFDFITDVAERDGDLQIVYGIDGGRELTEHVLDHLHGYEGARPVRIGNGAYEQRQHDVWGAVLDSVYLHTQVTRPARRPGLADAAAAGGARARALAGAGPGHLGGPRRAEALHLLQDHVLGRGRPRRPAGRGCARTGTWPRAWQAAADEIHADICERASTSAACSPSTTTPTRSTRRCC